jgi:hypothetical protein
MRSGCARSAFDADQCAAMVGMYRISEAAPAKTRFEGGDLGQIERSTVMTRIATTTVTLAFVLLLGAGNTALGQSAHEQHHPQQPGMMGPGMMGPGMMGSGMMGPGMMGPGMMGPGMMGQGMAPGMMGQAPAMMGPGMMGQGMHPGMMGPGMMGQGMHPGMMGQGTMGPGMQGLRVVPMMHLSTDDVRQFLQRHISAHGLTRLEVGEVTQSDDETITADIVTREGSLALRLEIDAYTGFVKSVS